MHHNEAKFQFLSSLMQRKKYNNEDSKKHHYCQYNNEVETRVKWLL